MQDRRQSVVEKFKPIVMAFLTLIAILTFGYPIYFLLLSNEPMSGLVAVLFGIFLWPIGLIMVIMLITLKRPKLGSPQGKPKTHAVRGVAIGLAVFLTAVAIMVYFTV